MKSKVYLSHYLQISIEKFLPPYNKIWMSTLFDRRFYMEGELFIWTYGCNNSETPARRSRHGMLNKGQRNKWPFITMGLKSSYFDYMAEFQMMKLYNLPSKVCWSITISEQSSISSPYGILSAVLLLDGIAASPPPIDAMLVAGTLTEGWVGTVFPVTVSLISILVVITPKL